MRHSSLMGISFETGHAFPDNSGEKISRTTFFLSIQQIAWEWP